MLGFLFGFAAIRAEEIPNGIMPQKRQVVGTGGTTSSNAPQITTSNPPPASTSTSQDNNNTPSSIPVTTSTAAGQTTSDVPTSDLTSNTGNGDSTATATGGGNNNGDGTKTTDTNTAAVQTQQGTKNSVVKVGSTTIDPKTLHAKTTVREPLVTKATRHQTLTSTWTSNGHVYSSVYTTKNVFESTTGYATATIAPSLANAGGNGSNLSTNTKKVIGGVVGGIGGAILIGGLAFVAWRLWGKKKKNEQETQQEDMYSNGSDSINAQKRMSDNTLGTYSEPYSNPNGAVNTASNF